MNNQKPQFRSWLIAQVNSGSYHGLRWLDHGKTMFRIPWKHASRQDLCENDYSIFKGWATVSGKCTDGPPKWKTNFRCALNNIDSFTLLEDNSKESTDPHKIYVITNDKVNSALDPNMDGTLQEDDNLESQLHISPETNLEQPNFALYDPQQSSAMFHNEGQLEEWIPDFELMNLSDSAEDQMAPGLFNPANIYNSDVNGIYNFQVPPGTPPQEVFNVSPAQVVPTDEYRELPSQTYNADQTCEPLLVPTFHVMENVTQEIPVHYPASDVPLNPAPGTQVEIPTVTQLPQVLRDFDITIYYRGKKVFQSTVSNANGCRLYHDEENERFAQLHHIRFPSTEEIKDHQQKKFTNHLLSNMAGGLLLENKNGDLFAKRLGKCQVFWTRSGATMNEESQKLNRNEEIKLFSLKDFYMECMEFMEQQRGMPQSSIFLCFGQQFRIGNEKKKLILVKIVPKICICLIEYTQQEGASSLTSDNVSLQMSNNSSTSSMENLMALIHELENLMELE
ncbi:interferon regulatory factor 7 [Hemiscyllium ocellatum]|uniref:interferon regulatory factor 7 n=1 Tax=Hemiscyllium ocellatum TaxID=170820 RepID=UPI0029676684|nr:interferon regulatory factor 7 [Hemiscyllium ocellatum]